MWLARIDDNCFILELHNQKVILFGFLFLWFYLIWFWSLSLFPVSGWILELGRILEVHVSSVRWFLTLATNLGVGTIPRALPVLIISLDLLWVREEISCRNPAAPVHAKPHTLKEKGNNVINNSCVNSCQHWSHLFDTVARGWTII